MLGRDPLGYGLLQVLDFREHPGLVVIAGDRHGLVDADQTIAEFAGRLKDAVDLDAIRDDLAGSVQAALEPAHVSVWTAPRD